MEKYKNKYRIASARAQWWDYSWAAAYFITICTKDRAHYFGEIVNGEMQLSPCGILADVFWHEIRNHTKSVDLGAFVVMPNHIHGILVLNGAGDLAETGHAPSVLPESESPSRSSRNIAKNSVSSIIGSYKSAVTKHANRMGLENGWQTRFHDHIIRNDGEYQRINDYIDNNPANWKEDKFFVKETE